MEGTQLYEGCFVPFWKTRGDLSKHPAHSDALLECVIIEPREHANLAGVIGNMSAMCPNAAMTIVHSRANQAFVDNIVPASTNVRCIPLFEDNINRNQYSALLADPSFWKDTLSCDKVLIYQTDTGMRKNAVLRFMEYDYIGAPWSWQVGGDDRINIGNGGYSLRTRKWMHDIAAKYERDPTYSDPTAGESEDIFFARHLIDCDDAILPDYATASAFAVEHNDHDDPMGFHQAYKFKSPSVTRALLSIAPYADIDFQQKQLITVRDAWIETDAGRVQPLDTSASVPALAPWLSLGINVKGMFIPANTKIPCLKEDPAFGQRKRLKFIFDTPHGDRMECSIALSRGRVPVNFVI